MIVEGFGLLAIELKNRLSPMWVCLKPGYMIWGASHIFGPTNFHSSWITSPFFDDELLIFGGTQRQSVNFTMFNPSKVNPNQSFHRSSLVFHHFSALFHHCFTVFAMVHHLGVSWNGATPRAGWLFSWKSQSKIDDLSVPPWLRKSPYISIYTHPWYEFHWYRVSLFKYIHHFYIHINHPNSIIDIL